MLELIFRKNSSTGIPTEQANESVKFFLSKSIGLLAPLVVYQKYFSNEEMREIFDIIKIPVIDLAIDFFLKRSNQQTKILLNNISNIIKNSNILKIFYDNKILEKAKLRNIHDNYYSLKKQMEDLLKKEIYKFIPQDNQVKTTQQMMYQYNPLLNKTDLKRKQQKEMQKVRKKIGELKDKIQHQYDNPVLPAILPEDEMKEILEMNKRNRDMEKRKIEVLNRIPLELEKLKKELNDSIKKFSKFPEENKQIIKKKMDDKFTIPPEVLYLLRMC
jgi:hypothetical protein